MFRKIGNFAVLARPLRLGHTMGLGRATLSRVTGN